MAENSPSKTRSSVMFHPYERKSSPSKLASTTGTTRPLALTNMSEGNYFSFSGGSSSLFPASKASRPAMNDVSNLVKSKSSPTKLVSTTRPLALTNMSEGNHFSFSGGSSSLFPASKASRPAMSDVSNLQKCKSSPSKLVCITRPSALTNMSEEVYFSFSHGSSSLSPASNTSRPATSGVSNLLKKNLTIKNAIPALVKHIPSPDSLPPNIAQMFAPTASCNDTKFNLSTSRGVLCERKNPLYDFPEYSLDILNYWLAYEQRSRPKRMYMSKQPEISHRMRTILVDWMVEVGMEYDMHGETIFLAVSCVDRFLSKMSVARNKLQLVGTAALFISSKYEEIQPPEIGDFVYITDETYTKQQVLQMELIMLNILSYDLMAPTAYDFVRTFSSILRLDSQTTCLAMYLTELAMMDGERYLHYLPSIIATAAISLSRYTFQNLFWDEKITILTTHSLQSVQHCAQHLFNSFYDAPTLDQTAIYDKYKAVRYCSISQTILPARLPWV